MDIFHMHISKYFLHWSMVRDIFSVCVTFIMEVVVKRNVNAVFAKRLGGCFCIYDHSFKLIFYSRVLRPLISATFAPPPPLVFLFYFLMLYYLML